MEISLLYKGELLFQRSVKIQSEVESVFVLATEKHFRINMQLSGVVVCALIFLVFKKSFITIKQHTALLEKSCF